MHLLMHTTYVVGLQTNLPAMLSRCCALYNKACLVSAGRPVSPPANLMHLPSNLCGRHRQGTNTLRWVTSDTTSCVVQVERHDCTCSGHQQSSCPMQCVKLASSLQVADSEVPPNASAAMMGSTRVVSATTCAVHARARCHCVLQPTCMYHMHMKS